MNLHTKRWVTSLLFAPLLLAIIYYSSEIIFVFFIIAVIEIAAWEYNQMFFSGTGNAWEKCEMHIFAFIIPLAFHFSEISAVVPAITFCLFVAFFTFLFHMKGPDVDVIGVGKVILGFLYMPFLISFFILLRHLSAGILWVIFTLVITFCGDIGGYYVGRTIGAHKLYPRVSPGKTVEGALGVIAGSLIGGLLFQFYFFPSLPFYHAAVMGILGGAMGQIGDLFESAVKRTAGVKDAGFIFPGHGGIMDRLDSLSFIAPFIFYYQQFVMR